MIHLVASGPTVLKTWRNSIPRDGDIVCAVSGASRYVDNDKLDWWVAADQQCKYSPLLDSPTPARPKIGILTDAPSVLPLHGCGVRVEVHDDCWPLPYSIRRFSAPCAAVWLLETYVNKSMRLYGVDLEGELYAWKKGPKVESVATSLTERWLIERTAWRVIDYRFPGRIAGLPFKRGEKP